MADVSTPDITLHHGPAGYASTGQIRPTTLTAAAREGLPPLDFRKDTDGGYSAEFDPVRINRDGVNHILHALGIPPSRPIEEIHAESAARAQALVDIELAARPGRPTIDISVWGGTTLTVPEPSWCTRGHEPCPFGDHPQDIYHQSAETDVQFTQDNGTRITLFSTYISDNPYSADPAHRGPRGVIWFTGFDAHTQDQDYDPDGLHQFARDLLAAALSVEKLRDQLIAARTEAGL